ncbi:hypothetical protein [Amycolatopsis aidingensis]|uniref:hypothetical protein n=1 Tax=Amycolatopsis aidingensis TaxID=2842453 RepID=UPI001C0B05C8|nr:hypothetical protein [Amycolatopsis aidingensis]
MASTDEQRRTTREPDATGRPRIPLAGVLTAAGAGAVLRAVGVSLPVVEGGSPGFTSAPMLIVLAALPAAVAFGLAAAGRRVIAAGVLAGMAALVPGSVVLDLQFVVDASLAARPELYLPRTVASPPPAAGFWLLLAGHLAIGIAGALAVRVIRRRPELDDGLPEAGRRRWLPLAVSIAVVASVGLLMAPFSSEDLYLLGRGAFESSTAPLFGSLLLACALPLAAAVGVSSGVTGLARGVLFGLAIGVAGHALPVAVSWQLPGLRGSAGPVLALVAALALVALGSVRFAAEESPDRSGDTAEAGEARLPGLGRLQFATGVLGLLTAAAAIAGALADQLVATEPFTAPESPARTSLLVAGVLFGVLALGMFVPGLAARVRPALSVAWAGVLLTGTAVLDTGVAATGIQNNLVQLGRGVLWVSMALVGAALTACCSVVAGMVEREDGGHGPDGAAPGTAGASLTAPLVAAAILAVGAFGTPVAVAPDYTAPGLWSNLGTPSIGLLAGLLTVLGAAALAPRSRPPRAAALLLGAACVLGLRAAELPLAGSGMPGASAGTGLWIAVAGVLALLLAAGIALVGNRERR